MQFPAPLDSGSGGPIITYQAWAWGHQKLLGSLAQPSSLQGFRRQPSERPSRSHCVSWVSFSLFRFAKKRKQRKAKEAWASWLPGQPACPVWDTVFAYRARVCDLYELPACVRTCVRMCVCCSSSFFCSKSRPLLSPSSFRSAAIAVRASSTEVGI